jgi:hypothetical protein
MRYRVRNAKGEELVVPSLRDLHDLYVHGFVSDDDLVRSETTSRWIPAGTMPALHGVREKRAGPRKAARLLAAAAIVAAVIALLLGR